jgi:hypothetical protein
MQSGKASGESESAGDAPAGIPATGRLHDADARALLDFFDRERRRSWRGALTAGAAGAVFGALAILAAHAAGWLRIPAPPAADDAVAKRIAELENGNGVLAAQLRALASQPRGAPSPAPSDAAAPPSRKESSDAAIAGKPSGSTLDARERASRVGDDSVVRALDRARLLEDPAKAAAGHAPATDATVPGAVAPAADGAAAPAPQKPVVEEAHARPPDAVLAAFNTLLRDCGFDRWRLLSADPVAEDHALRRVVLVHSNPSGTATGSLTADRLTLERDAASGVAGFVLSGARQIDLGVEEAFPNGTTRFDIPGVLPLDLVAPELASLFGVAASGAIGSAARFDPADPTQVTKAINRVLELEKTVAVRVRSCDKFTGEKLEKAVIDLLYDDHGAPRQTVYADVAWFEIDAKHDSAELCCEGGEMVIEGSRRPLFRGRLRWTLYSISPSQWVGMPSLKRVAGS